MGRFMKVGLWVAALLLLSLRAAHGSEPGPVPGMPAANWEIQLFQWAVTQGGLVVVVLWGGWQWRRDYQRVFQFERERTQELLITITRAIDAMATHAELIRDQNAAYREQAKAFSDLSGTVRACEAVRDIFKNGG